MMHLIEELGRRLFVHTNGQGSGEVAPEDQEERVQAVTSRVESLAVRVREMAHDAREGQPGR